MQRAEEGLRGRAEACPARLSNTCPDGHTAWGDRQDQAVLCQGSTPSQQPHSLDGLGPLQPQGMGGCLRSLECLGVPTTTAPSLLLPGELLVIIFYSLFL